MRWNRVRARTKTTGRKALVRSTLKYTPALPVLCHCRFTLRVTPRRRRAFGGRLGAVCRYTHGAQGGRPAHRSRPRLRAARGAAQPRCRFGSRGHAARSAGRDASPGTLSLVSSRSAASLRLRRRCVPCFAGAAACGSAPTLRGCAAG